MQQLEETEPDLAEYLLETLSSIHHELLGLHGPAAKTHRVYRQISVMTLVCIESLRQSHFELWQQQMDGPAGQNDPDRTEPDLTS